jgi:hypothetical protein
LYVYVNEGLHVVVVISQFYVPPAPPFYEDIMVWTYQLSMVEEDPRFPSGQFSAQVGTWVEPPTFRKLAD